MTRQETFDTVVAHLRKQGRKATAFNKRDIRVCCYRGDEGTKCAAGCLIPDDRYQPGLEGFRALRTTKVGELLIELGHDTSLVCELQSIHDGYEVCEWEEAFANVARDYELTYTPAEAP
jgi:hypothetical protein